MNGTPLSFGATADLAPDDSVATVVEDFTLLRGRFEATFGDSEAAKAAARDARSVGFVVEVSQESADGWLIVGRRKQPFPSDERDRYASRLNAIATGYSGAFSRFVEEPLEARRREPTG
jgi:hypothetical protein